MSFFDDASLVMIPSGYKTSKVYSVKPTDGTGDLTFTRSNDTATRVASNGLIEKVRTNQVRNSTMVGASAPSTLPTNWTLNSAGLTFTVIGTGTEDGLTYIEVNATGTASSSNARIGFDSSTQILGATGQYWTNSFYFKKVSETAAPDNYAMAIFENTVAGTLVLANVGSLAATTSLARYSYTVLTSGGATVARVQPFVRFSLSTLSSYDFTFRIAATQMETGDIATPYIATTTAAVSVGPVANVPRLDYLNSSCPRLLLEPQRTNLAQYSEQFDNASWTKARATITANATTSPDGTTNADKFIENTANDSHAVLAAISNTSGQQYAVTIYAKASERNWFLIYIGGGPAQGKFFNLSNGTLGGVLGNAPNDSSIINVGNGWYRCSITYTATDVSSDVTFQLATSDGTNSYTGDGTSGVYIWGAQLELGAYATSYIPTLGASVTRGADACSKTGISSLIGQTEGTLFADFVWTKVGKTYQSILCGGTSNFNNTVYILTTESSGAASYQLRIGGATAIATISTTFATGTRYKIALAYKSGSIAFYVNGVSVGTSSATYGAVSEAISQFRYDWPYGGDEQWCSPVNQTLLFPTRLTNAQMAELTTL
jgi:hypothetical protein